MDDELHNASFFLSDNCSGCGNGSQPGEDFVSYHLRPETYIVPVLFALIFIVGVLGNGTLVLIFIQHRNMRNVPNTYIFSLALGDLLVIVTSVPFTATVYTFDSWPYGVAVCKLSECAKDVSVGVSVFTLTALSADRFFAIVDPMRKLNTGGSCRRASRFTVAIAVGIWALAVVCAAPAAVTSYLRQFHVNANTSFQVCYPYPSGAYSWYMVTAKFVVYYAIPLLIIGFFYTLMARHLLLSTVNMPGEAQGQAKQIRARKKVAKMVLSFVIVFAVCFFPQHVFMLWFYNCPTSHEDYNGFWHAFRIVGFCLGFVNSCINPIALCFVSGAFRKHFKRYLLCREGRVKDGEYGRRTSCSLTTSRRNLSTLASFRRDERCYLAKPTWDSPTAGATFNTCAARRIPLSTQLSTNHLDDFTVTTFMNGGGGGVGDVTIFPGKS